MNISVVVLAKNNQKTIEKITGRSMVSFSKTILTIGEGAV